VKQTKDFRPLILTILGWLALAVALHATDAPKPNIVLILALQLCWAAISHLDEAVGRVVAEVDRLGQRDNTVFNLLSDNPWKPFGTGKTMELYNRTRDSGEKMDLAAQNPDLVRQLRAKLETQAVTDNAAVPDRTATPTQSSHHTEK